MGKYPELFSEVKCTLQRFKHDAKSFIQHSQKAERTILLCILEWLLMLVACRKSLVQWM